MNDTGWQSRRHFSIGSLASTGYRLAAEWESHAGTWLAWPWNRDTWPGAFTLIPQLFARFAHTIAEHEPVHICAAGNGLREEAERLLGGTRHITLHDIPTNDAWIRDYGPLFLSADGDQPATLLDFQYNAWGGKYPPFDDDNRVPNQIATITGQRRIELSMVLEGGAIEVNGSGSAIVTEQCLLNPNRNPGMSRAEIEQQLADHLAVTNFLWLARGIAGDDTDGHIDQLARFVGPRHVVTMIESDASDENHQPLAENLTRLQTLTDEQGRLLDVTTIALPRAKYFGKQRLPCSYANFYIANGLVIVPTFDDPADDVALGTLQELFADRTVVGLPALDLIWGLGAFHCASKQQPLSFSG